MIERRHLSGGSAILIHFQKINFLNFDSTRYQNMFRNSAKLMFNAEIHSPNKSILDRMFKNLETFKANANFCKFCRFGPSFEIQMTFFNCRNQFTTSVNGILLPKLFWPTVRKNCSSDREKLSKNFEITRTICSNSERSEQYISSLWLKSQIQQSGF